MSVNMYKSPIGCPSTVLRIQPRAVFIRTERNQDNKYAGIIMRMDIIYCLRLQIKYIAGRVFEPRVPTLNDPAACLIVAVALRMRRVYFIRSGPCACGCGLQCIFRCTLV